MLDNAIHLWRIDLGAAISRADRLHSTLSADEAKRAARFRFEEDRAKFIVARSSMRMILARLLNCAPEAVEFDYTGHGKPMIRRQRPETIDWTFNLSHSGDLAILAVARAGGLGVDLERLRSNLDCLGLARRFFSADEVAQLQAAMVDEQMQAFFSIWTRKEALVKGHGRGLSLPLDQFSVSLVPEETHVLWHGESGADDLTGWSVAPLAVAPGYVGAVAVSGPMREFVWEADGT